MGPKVVNYAFGMYCDTEYMFKMVKISNKPSAKFPQISEVQK